VDEHASEEQNEGRPFVAATCKEITGAEKSFTMTESVISARYRAIIRGSPLSWKWLVSNIKQCRGRVCGKALTSGHPCVCNCEDPCRYGQEKEDPSHQPSAEAQSPEGGGKWDGMWRGSLCGLLGRGVLAPSSGLRIELRAVDALGGHEVFLGAASFMPLPFASRCQCVYNRKKRGRVGDRSCSATKDDK
jgi:hypothetical protein